MTKGDDDGESLDRQFGPPPGDSDLDPTHLRALAVRIQQLAGIIDLQRADGRRRDEHIDGVRLQVVEARKDIDKLDGDVGNLIRQQMTDEDKATLRALMRGYAFKDQAWKAILRYAGYASAVATGVYVLREPLRTFFSSIGRAISP